MTRRIEKTIEGRIVGDEIVSARYGWVLIGNQEPYFSINYNSSFVGYGANRELMTKGFPELVSLLKWHGFHIYRGPWYYIENGKFWLEMYYGKIVKGIYAPDPKEAFCSTVVFGIVEGDVFPELQWFESWAMNRKPRLMELFHNDMIKFDLAYRDSNGTILIKE